MSDVTLTVTDPTKFNDKFGQSFITYKINSNVTRFGFTPGNFTVERRYSDFSWLVSELSQQYAGIIIAPLPDKQAVGRFSAEFIESRRRSLEKFLLRVLAHPELGQASLLVTFLQASEDTLARAKEDAKAAKPKLTSSAMAWFEGTVNTLANGKAELEKSAADIKVEEISQYVAQQDKLMAAVTKHAETASKKDADMAHAYFELGQSLTSLGQSEEEAISYGFSQMGATVDNMSSLLSTHAEAGAVKFLEPLQEYARMLACIKAAVGQRQDRKSAYLQALVDVEAKQAAHRKVMGVPGKESQAKAKEQHVINAQDACEHARKEFEKVSERLLSEFELFKLQKGADLKETLQQLVSLQIDFHRKAHEAWAELLPRIEGIAASDPAAQVPQQQQRAAGQPAAPLSASPAHRPVSGRSDFQEQDYGDDDELVGV